MTNPQTTSYLPFAIPDIGDREICEVAATLHSGWLTTGDRAHRFESAFKVYAGAPHALALNSGTAALHVALAALGIGPGDEVITTPLTFCATVNVILEVGATPVLADIGYDLNIDPTAVRRAITKRTRAIIPVHLAGLPCEMDRIWAVAKEFGLHVVDDAAHATDARYRGQPIGAGASDAVAYSFYVTKNLCTGEGGMVTTHSAELADRMKVLSLHGISRDAWNRYSENGNWYYEVVECGFKYNMSDIAAAIGLVQLERLEAMHVRRAEIARRYSAAFEEMPEVETPPEREDCRHAWHLYILRLNLERLMIDRARFFDEMKRRKVGCSVHFIPVPLHPYYRKTLELREPCTRALAEYPRLLSLPLYSKMTDEEVDRVIQAVRDTVAHNSVREAVAFHGREATNAVEEDD
jgi:dTDP-4-amino-4,6-dideoxygalactose transaminase